MIPFRQPPTRTSPGCASAECHPCCDLVRHRATTQFAPVCEDPSAGTSATASLHPDQAMHAFDFKPLPPRFAFPLQPCYHCHVNHSALSSLSLTRLIESGVSNSQAGQNGRKKSVSAPWLRRNRKRIAVPVHPGNSRHAHHTAGPFSLNPAARQYRAAPTSRRQSWQDAVPNHSRSARRNNSAKNVRTKKRPEKSSVSSIRISLKPMKTSSPRLVNASTCCRKKYLWSIFKILKHHPSRFRPGGLTPPGNLIPPENSPSINPLLFVPLSTNV